MVAAAAAAGLGVMKSFRFVDVDDERQPVRLNDANVDDVILSSPRASVVVARLCLAESVLRPPSRSAGPGRRYVAHSSPLLHCGPRMQTVATT